MHPSSRPSVPLRSRRFDKRRTEVKPSQGAKREDKITNMASSSPLRGTRGPPESSRLKGPGQGARAPVVQSKLVRPQKNGAHAIPAISKPKSGHTVSNPVPAVDPNCNEPSLPCLCCDGHSPQDINSLFNHNHNNNNTVNIGQQMKLPPPQKELAAPKLDIKEDECKPEVKQPHVIPVEEREEENGSVDEKEGGQLKNDECSVNVNANVDENGNGNCNGEDGEDDEDEDDEDDDTLVPSCCNCPESMLDFSLTSSTSSSSTSISSCSDLECDCPETFSLSSQDQEATECYPSTLSPDSKCPAFQSSVLPLDLNTSARSPCSSDEGYPSAPCSPSSDYIDSKGSEEGKCIKVDLLHFLDSIEELGKMDLFYRIVRLARWELDGELIVRDRLDHQQKLQRVNKEVKLAYLVKLQEEGLDFVDEDITGVLDEMGNIEIPWKLYKSNKSSESQEFSDAGVDLTAPSDLDETPASDSLAPSPLDPPPRPPKPPTRHVSAHPESHTYENINGQHVFSVSSTNDATSIPIPALPVLSSSPPPLKPPALPPPPLQPVPYFTLNTDRPALTSPTPPIPPPRRRHKARLEAQRLAELEREKAPLSLPPPTSRPPPLPPPPAMSSPPAIPPPPSLPPPPSFHALDVEIRKLLALAGLTQAELLKLSPELGVCVDVVLENEPQPMSDVSQIGEFSLNRTHKEEGIPDKGYSILREGFGKDSSDTFSEKEVSKDKQKEANRTTSFTEMARRRKRNGGHCNHSCSCVFGSPNSFYSTDLSNTNIPNVSFGSFDYTSVIADTPPPPPPRPLPPCPPIASNPPELPPLKPCTLPANASRPDRFDWLIAFTPDTESPPLEMRKSLNDAMLQKGPTSTLGSKVTTFKELRNRSKQSSQPAPVQPEPDPTVITPDPDFLYNLKWRREKIDGDGWEYTSQAQTSFLQPPPTPASLSLFREMCRLNKQEDCPAEPKVFQQIGCSVSEGSLRTICDERDKAVHTKKMDDEDKVEVRGLADGAWTLETRTTVSSPPLSLSSTSPYYLHSAPLSQASQFYYTDTTRDRAVTRCEGSINISNPLCINSTFDCIKDDYTDSLYCAGPENNKFVFCKQENDLNGNMDSLYHRCNHADSFLDSLYVCGHEKNSFCPHNSGVDSIRNYDSLYSDARYTRSSLKLFTDPKPPTDINTLSEGDITPYKNIDMQTYITMRNLKNQSYVNKNSYKDTNLLFDLNSDKIDDSKPPINPILDQNSNENTTQNKQQLVSFPAYYLYHPKNCPLHKGAPPRLSPVGAISPPHRSGPPVPGTDVSRLCSPLFPRSHTLPALAAPLYYPYLYTPPVQAPLREPSVPILHSQQSPPPLTLTVRSFSFAGSEQKNVAWMGEDVRPSLSAERLSSACLQEKKTLVNSVSVAVEAILAQFNLSRTVVQKFHSVDKTLSGDSSVNPCLGRLVLQCLCPALRNLLSDGLKPHQSDLIAGRRPNSPWGLVQASTKPGPSTQALHSLQTKVAGLPQLRQSRHKFNAFLFGLLNVKLLDYWLSHLQSCSDVLETYYRPTSFMRLSLTSCQSLFEELLLLLQPLSLLTFNLDLLFQHHHLDPSSPTLTPASHTSEIYSPPNEDFSFHLSPKGLFQGGRLGSELEQDHGGLGLDTNPNSGLTSHVLDVSAYRNPISLSSDVTKEEANPPLSWFKGNDISTPLNVGSISQQAGQALQQGWGAVMRLGERLGQNFGLATTTEDVKGPNSPDDFKTGFSLNLKSPDENRQQPRDDLSSRDSGAAVPWGLGRLFGASKCPNNPPTSRRPSQWLSPGVSVLSRLVNLGQDSPPEKREPQRSKDKEEDENEKINETRDQPKPLRMVRTLCDHTGTGAELSFCKGEELVLLGGVDHDWIRCRQGHNEGLVPIGYASLIM
uniref:RUN and SH3 domain containing 1 n=2 Tax=Cyprinus carpio TaxID=7962 RepID=A0A8C1V146_CYPCA